MIVDSVKFTGNRPYNFVISGRTKHFINAFGEELIVENAEKGLNKACAATGAQIIDYSAAPVFMDEHAKCRRQWLVEFARMPDSLEKFAKLLDDTTCLTAMANLSDSSRVPASALQESTSRKC